MLNRLFNLIEDHPMKAFVLWSVAMLIAGAVLGYYGAS